MQQILKMTFTSIWKKAGTCLMAWMTFSALLLVIGNGGNIYWFPPPVVFSLIGLSLLLTVVYPFIWHKKENNQKGHSAKIYSILYAFIRYCIVFNLATFGWKKMLGLQFIVPDEIAGKPMNQQTGEWLTWYYFGYSAAFGFIIAAIQIGGSLLLLFRRTVLIGSIILLALMFNLLLVNIFYQMNAGALLQSVVLTAGLIFLVLQDYKRLVQFFLKTEPAIPSINPPFKLTLKVSVLILSLLFVLYLKTI